MKYEINFDNNTVENIFMELYHSFEWSEDNFEEKDLERNIRNATHFQSTVRMLKIFGAETEVGTYYDNGFDRIGYAKINNHEFVKNGKINYSKLKDALWEIAHPEQKEDVISIEEMSSAIRTFIDENLGTDDGEQIYRKRIYIRDDNYDEIKKLYDEVLVLYKAM